MDENGSKHVSRVSGVDMSKCVPQTGEYSCKVNIGRKGSKDGLAHAVDLSFPVSIRPNKDGTFALMCANASELGQALNGIKLGHTGTVKGRSGLALAAPVLTEAEKEERKATRAVARKEELLTELASTDEGLAKLKAILVSKQIDTGDEDDVDDDDE